MDMFEELKAWADKWNVQYCVSENESCSDIYFVSQTYFNPVFSYNKETGDFAWYGGD